MRHRYILAFVPALITSSLLLGSVVAMSHHLVATVASEAVTLRAPSDVGEGREAVVSFADLNPADATAARLLYRRIAAAADTLCALRTMHEDLCRRSGHVAVGT